MNILETIASIASIVSLLLTISVLVSVRRIQSFYVFTARVPELAEKLGSHYSKIVDYRNDFDSNIPNISLELVRAQAVLKNLKQKVTNPSKKEIAQLLKTIRGYQRKSNDKDKLWEVIVSMSGVLAEIEELQADKKWER